MSTIVRAQVAHTPCNPFVSEDALETFADGAVAFDDGRIVACGGFAEVRSRYPDAPVVDARDAVLLPGFVDCHVHFPQIRVIGAMGLELLDWLRSVALPEEARLADVGYAASIADQFVRGLARNGTTTALVFGSHFVGAQEALFSCASAAGLRVTSGLVVSDRGLLPELHVSLQVAFESSRELIEPLARPGSDPLRGQSALLGLVLGGAAVGVRGAGARGLRGARDQPPERGAGRDRVGRDAVSVGARLPGDV